MFTISLKHDFFPHLVAYYSTRRVSVDESIGPQTQLKSIDCIVIAITVKVSRFCLQAGQVFLYVFLDLVIITV